MIDVVSFTLLGLIFFTRVAVSARLISQSLTRAQSTCTSAIPIIDITPLREANASHDAKKAVAKKISAACEEVRIVHSALITVNHVLRY